MRVMLYLHIKPSTLATTVILLSFNAIIAKNGYVVSRRACETTSRTLQWAKGMESPQTAALVVTCTFVALSAIYITSPEKGMIIYKLYYIFIS